MDLTNPLGKRISQMVQQLSDLREALRPFATFAGALPPVIEGQPRLTDAGPAFTAAPLGQNFIVTFADLRHAKALLDKLEAEDAARTVEDAELRLAGFDCERCGTRVVPFVGGPVGFCSAECKEAEEAIEIALGLTR